ncbi:MAG: hypothetical protein QUU85_13085 [Candidatus Eisenbacteria bacterium]|nr:hypothetical protein [Candidatus Eisenbacteria bacterium]
MRGIETPPSRAKAALRRNVRSYQRPGTEGNARSAPAQRTLGGAPAPGTRHLSLIHI